MASRQFKPVIWNKFTQTPVRPEIAENPVTLVLNMELTKDNSIRTRRAFKSGLNCSAPESHITTHLFNSDKNSDLIMKVGDTIKKKTGDTSTQSLSYDSVSYGQVQSESPGFFSAYGGEVYFCQEKALFSYDGNTTRNLGVPPLVGNYAGTEPKIRSAVDFTGASDFCGYFCQPQDPTDTDLVQLPASGLYCCGEPDDGEGEGNTEGWNGNCGFSEGTNVNCNSGGDCDNDVGEMCPAGYNTFLCMPQQGTLGGTYCWHVVESAGVDTRGEKILNCAFKVSLYDPKRGTFGRACEPKSVIHFGPNREQYAMYQYHILASTPGDLTGYGVAIWCSTGQEVMTVRIPGANFNTLILYNEVHGMSNHLTDMMYLEDIIVDGTQSVDCGALPDGYDMCLFKDQASLASSGQYTDQYARPVPSKAMAILPNGVALYFYPREVGGYDTSSGNYDEPLDNYESIQVLTSHRPGVEYSVNHPEQIGRNTYNQNDTFSPLPAMRGAPMYALNDGGVSLMFTRQSIYQLSFNGTPQVKDLGGPGAITHKSIHPTSSGTLYAADEGPVWFKGGKAVEVLRELGFDSWIDPLDKEQRGEVRVGLIEDCKKLLMTFPVPGFDSRYRAVMHDIGSDFTSEWWMGSGQQITPSQMRSKPGSTDPVTYMISHRGDDGYSFHMWLNNSGYVYDPTSDGTDGNESATVSSCVEVWVSENPNLTKHLGEVVLGLGHRGGDVTLRVSAFDSPADVTRVQEKPLEERTATVRARDGQRYATAEFQGMQGKYIRIRIEANNKSMEVHQIIADIGYDDDPKTANEENSVEAYPSPDP